MSDWTVSHLIELGIVGGFLLAAIMLVAAAGVVRARRTPAGARVSASPRCDRSLDAATAPDCLLDEQTAVRLVGQVQVCSDVLCLRRTRRALETRYGGDAIGRRLARLIDLRLEALR
jgi:hypothetical protein